MISTGRWPMRSLSDPVNGAENADEKVSKPRNSPATAVEPPSSRIRYGAVGSSWNTDTNTVKL